jgi:dienelactone hydrolase
VDFAFQTSKLSRLAVRREPWLAFLALVLIGAQALVQAGEPDPGAISRWATVELDSLETLSVPSLRARPYGSILKLVGHLGTDSGDDEYHRHFSADGTPPYASRIAEYRSDGLRVYTRIDIPAMPAPERGYPVVIFVHGWYGADGAPGYDFAYKPDSIYTRAIDAWVDRGYLVVSPALRGHGQVNGIAADGIEFLQAWDNSSYLSPIYYAIDVLNLLEGLDSLNGLDGSDWKLEDEREVRLDLARIHISAQSQGADAALTALAVSGEGSGLRHPLSGGSLWSGCFAPRFEQLEVYRPMSQTLEAFMSGDGNWTSTAIGADGSVNANFVFGWPPDWIGTTDRQSEEWTWQAETWTTPTVRDSLQRNYTRTYDILNRQVADIDGVQFELLTDDEGRVSVRHDAAIEAAMARIGGYGWPEYLTEPVLLHHSDQDYYALPRWNAGLAQQINEAGGTAWDFTYPANTHSLLVSEHDWFSPPGTEAGFDLMIARDDLLMRGGNPSDISGVGVYPPSGHGNVPGPESLAELAGARMVRFHTVNEREPLEGMPRRVVRYEVDGLTQYALVMEPAGEAPAEGWPVLVANHGFHPWPPDNGRRTDDGVTDRPGDYYRGIPAAFARLGFLVVWPDFRGHNISQGLQYVAASNAVDWYARDSVAAFRAAATLPEANPARMYMWGHSMGSGVTLRAALALGDELTGVSVWSTRANDMIPLLGRLKAPLIIHHAERETVIAYDHSATLAGELTRLGKIHALHAYDSDAHFLDGADRQQAIHRDARWFRRAEITSDR